MAVVVTLQGTTLQEDRGIVVAASRRLVVTELLAGVDLLERALADPGMPVYGDAHPQHSGIVVVRRSPKAITTEDVEVELEYAQLQYELQPQQPRLTFGAALRQIETSKDRDGAIIVLAPPGKVAQGGVLSVSVPENVIAFEETRDTDTPGALARAYLGHVNSVTWQGGFPGTWLWTSVRGELLGIVPAVPVGTVQRWRLQWEATFSPLGWQPIAEWIDPETGRPAPDAAEGVHYKTVTWYPEADFNDLFAG